MCNFLLVKGGQMYLKREKFLIVGISKSGISSCEFLLGKGAKCYVYDDYDSETITRESQRLVSLGAVKVEKEEVFDVLKEMTVIVLSPGVPIDSEIAIVAKKLNKRIVGELELASYFTT